MGAGDFGRLAKHGRRRLGQSKSELARRLGRLPESGRVFDAAGITRIEEGGPVKVDHELVQAAIDALGIDDPVVAARLGFDAADLWHAAGLWPEDLPVELYRDFIGAGHPGAAAASSRTSNPRSSNNLYFLRHTGDQLKIPA